MKRNATGSPETQAAEPKVVSLHGWAVPLGLPHPEAPLLSEAAVGSISTEARVEVARGEGVGGWAKRVRGSRGTGFRLRNEEAEGSEVRRGEDSRRCRRSVVWRQMAATLVANTA